MWDVGLIDEGKIDLGRSKNRTFEASETNNFEKSPPLVNSSVVQFSLQNKTDSNYQEQMDEDAVCEDTGGSDPNELLLVRYGSKNFVPTEENFLATERKTFWKMMLVNLLKPAITITSRFFTAIYDYW